MAGDIEATKQKVAEGDRPRIKRWVAALASLGALYVPLTPLILEVLEGKGLYWFYVVGLPMFLPMRLFVGYFDVNLPFGIHAFRVLINVLTFLWLVGLHRLSYKSRRNFWIAIAISAGVSAVSGTAVYWW